MVVHISVQHQLLQSMGLHHFVTPFALCNLACVKLLRVSWLTPCACTCCNHTVTHLAVQYGGNLWMHFYVAGQCEWPACLLQSVYIHITSHILVNITLIAILLCRV